MSSNWNNKKDFTKQETFSLFQHHKGMLKTAAVSAILLSSVTFNLVFATGSEDRSTIDKIYHIYVGKDYVGAVSNVASVQKIVEVKEKEAKTQFKELSVDAESSISLVPEQVYSYQTNDTEVLSLLNEQLVAKADAYALNVDGQPVVYLKNKEDYEETLRLLKLEYVTEKQLAELEANEITSGSLPELEVNQTRILEIKIEDVSGKEAKIIPSKILTPEDAVQYLQTGTLEKELYTVKAGDVLGSIAMNHDLTTKELLALNPDLTEESVLQIGQEINVTVEKPLVNVQVVLEKLKREKIDYEKIIEQDENMYKGEQVVKQEGSFGKKEVSYLITEVNGQVEEKAVTNEVILEEPVDHIVKVGTKVISSRGTGDFAWPTNGGYISSTMGTRWGEFHRGIDIARPSNYNIKAADNGVVTAAGWDGTYGYRIIINHNNGYETLYAHLSRIDVNIGQVIPKGSVIGIMGSTGNSTGTHLHFEVHKNGAIVNPLAYF
ncbi:membrane protein [Ureibacillus massiliensis 4400831 = CIP 108448 = CCUG 49529]|uniref:Membrane protein n=1 Tax=Ureibacillus massiliensis 4400831 = CIP 108448 = CCUG 49529 TaxID=1211035 RepID=A0A0A3J4N0_9BACL|nr:peptidoglycan DD-metalloendopeptidase family protein [Ureibacillus massiliensis]KGR91876.1 membrane protein [Ureibacillus massiliensis 4400831 = CIP 108448 = CCUG 49529]